MDVHFLSNHVNIRSSDAPLEELEVDRTAEDLDQDGHGLMAIVKDAAKKRKEKSAAKLAAEEDAFEPPLDVEVPEIKIKSKKEKEREKKERMKEEKKNKSQSSAGQKLEDVVGDDVSSSAAKPIRSKKQFDSSAPSKDSANSTDGTDTPAPPLSDSQATTVPSDLSVTDFPSPPISHATKAKSSKKKVPSATISALRVFNFIGVNSFQLICRIFSRPSKHKKNKTDAKRNSG